MTVAASRLFSAGSSRPALLGRRFGVDQESRPETLADGNAHIESWRTYLVAAAQSKSVHNPLNTHETWVRAHPDAPDRYVNRR
jgi:hypothetical protein